MLCGSLSIKERSTTSHQLKSRVILRFFGALRLRVPRQLMRDQTEKNWGISNLFDERDAIEAEL